MVTCNIIDPVLQPLGKIFAFTDGSCDPNPGPGGYCAILLVNRGRPPDDSVDSLGLAYIWTGHNLDTTNNRMELKAVIAALSGLKRPTEVHIISDSKYVLEGISKWIDGWKANGWRTSSKQPVKNQDLWMVLDEVRTPHTVHWHHIHGHQESGNAHVFWNNIADEIACQERKIAQGKLEASNAS